MRYNWLSAPPNDEIGRLDPQRVNGWDLMLIVYGLLGVAVGAFQWNASPWFIDAKQRAAEWLIEHAILWPLSDNAPWWLLTHYPANNDLFSWLDGAMITGYILATAALLGSWVLLWLAFAARMLGSPWRANTIRLSYSLVPLAGCGVFLGLSALTVSLLKTEGISFHWLPAARVMLLGGAALWSLWLAGRQLAGSGKIRQIAGLLLLLPALAAVIWSWLLLFIIW